MLKRLFGGGGDKDGRPKKIVKAEKKITNMYVQRADRQYFLDFLRQEGTDLAARALIKRFSVSADNTTVDRDEKELTAHYLVQMGEVAIEPLKDFIRTNDLGVNWPFRTLREMISEADLVAFLKEVLDSIGPEYVRDPERKEQLILLAKEHESEEIAKAVLPYLNDDNETIRFVAADTVISFAANHEFVRTPLADRLIEDESNRVVNHVAKAFAENGWTIALSDPEHSLEEFMPEGYRLEGDVLVGL